MLGLYGFLSCLDKFHDPEVQIKHPETIFSGQLSTSQVLTRSAQSSSSWLWRLTKRQPQVNATSLAVNFKHDLFGYFIVCYDKRYNHYLVGGFQPIWNILVFSQLGSSPQVGVNIQHIWNHQPAIQQYLGHKFRCFFPNGRMWSDENQNIHLKSPRISQLRPLIQVPKNWWCWFLLTVASMIMT